MLKVFICHKNILNRDLNQMGSWGSMVGGGQCRGGVFSLNHKCQKIWVSRVKVNLDKYRNGRKTFNILERFPNQFVNKHCVLVCGHIWMNA